MFAFIYRNFALIHSSVAPNAITYFIHVYVMSYIERKKCIQISLWFICNQVIQLLEKIYNNINIMIFIIGSECHYRFHSSLCQVIWKEKKIITLLASPSSLALNAVIYFTLDFLQAHCSVVKEKKSFTTSSLAVNALLYFTNVYL